MKKFDDMNNDELLKIIGGIQDDLVENSLYENLSLYLMCNSINIEEFLKGLSDDDLCNAEIIKKRTLSLSPNINDKDLEMIFRLTLNIYNFMSKKKK